jgi:hypothetical protein
MAVVVQFQKAGNTLEPPNCRACAVAMKWYRAALKSKEPRVIANYFACTRCDGLAVIDHATGADAKSPAVFLSDELTATEQTVWLARKAQ